MDKNRDRALRALEASRGDDLYRARRAFAGMTDEQMAEQHGESGCTRAEVLAGYERQSREVDDAIAWVKAVELPAAPGSIAEDLKVAEKLGYLKGLRDGLQRAENIMKGKTDG